MKCAYFLTGLRWLIAVVYIVSGGEKLFQPYQNFVYVIQGYDLLRNAQLEQWAALTFPWLEYFLGGLLLLGLWTRFALRGIGLFSVVFIFAVGQAMARRLPMDECGCFGDLVGMPLAATLTIDIVILCSVIVLLRFYDRGTTRWSLDHCWLNKREAS